MKTAEIGKVIDQFLGCLNNETYFDQGKTKKLVEETAQLKTSLTQMVIGEEFSAIFEALCKKGMKVIEEIKTNKNDVKGNLSRAKMYVRYLKSAEGDFKGLSTSAIQRYFRVYMGTAILFLALSPMYFGFVLPALMFVPIFLGIRGIKNRSFSGLTLSAMVIPVALMTAMYWIRYGMGVMGNPEQVAGAMATAGGFSTGTAMLLTVVPPILAVALLYLTIMTIINGLKAKNYFI